MKGRREGEEERECKGKQEKEKERGGEGGQRGRERLP